MANVSADEVPQATLGDDAIVQNVVSGDFVPFAGGVSYKFKMIGMDANVDGLYDTWVVSGTPDDTGASYAGALDTPLRDIAIAASWTV